MSNNCSRRHTNCFVKTLAIRHIDIDCQLHCFIGGLTIIDVKGCNKSAAIAALIYAYLMHASVCLHNWHKMYREVRTALAAEFATTFYYTSSHDAKI